MQTDCCNDKKKYFCLPQLLSDSDVNQISCRRTRAVLRSSIKLNVLRGPGSVSWGELLPWKYCCFPMGHDSSLCLGQQATSFYAAHFAEMTFPLKYFTKGLSAKNLQDHQTSVEVWDRTTYPMRRLSLLSLVYEQ